MKIINYKKDESIKKDVTPLYIDAFPEEERPPVNIFYQIGKKDFADIEVYYTEKDEFIGFTLLTYNRDLLYLFFLAVTPSKRNQGYGSKILDSIKERFKDKNILICYDEIDDKYDDIELRTRRKNFYNRNGFKDNNLKTFEYGVVYDTCYRGKHKVSYQEYEDLYLTLFGKEILKNIHEVK